jgi:hypothetical protein
MSGHFAVVHIAGYEALDDPEAELAPIERRWTGRAGSSAEARDAWAAAHGDDRFAGEVAAWTADRLGLDQLLVFRVPASPFDFAGWISLVLTRGNPIAYVEVRGFAHRPPLMGRQAAAKPSKADASLALPA